MVPIGEDELKLNIYVAVSEILSENVCDLN